MVARLTLLALVLVAAPALADHVFSHRVVVTGRVIDAEGMPVPGQAVTVRFAGLEAEAPCFDSRDERTGPQGDFTVCRHAHVVPSDVSVNVSVGEAAVDAPVDPSLRRVAVLLRLPGGSPARDVEGERLFARTYHVEGRLMQREPGGARVEGVEVAAVPLAGEVVRVALRHDGRALAEANVTSNQHGDYAIDLAGEDVPPGAVVRIALRGAERIEPASAAFRRSDVDVVQMPEGAGGIDERPGTRTPEVPASGALSALVALGAAAVIASRAR